MQGSGCPFAGAAKRDAASISLCPFASKLTPAADDTPAAPAATCPLGFGTSRGPKLSTLHCPVCKGLLFDAHKISSCQHTFCRSCISQTRDCPSCGRDVDGLEPNSELAGLVDTFLDTHSKSPDLVAAQADLGPLPDNSAASFYMAQGLKSLAGGNLHAAMHRLGKAKQGLLESSLAPPTPSELAPAGIVAAAAGTAATGGLGFTGVSLGGLTADASSQGVVDDTADSVGTTDRTDNMYADVQSTQQQQPGSAATAAVSRAVQLATVCGCLGDCYQRLSQSEQADQQYRESVAAVQPFLENSAEAAHAMSVSLNKLGDAQYLSQQLPAAKALYRQALQLRQLCCGPLTSGQAGPQEQLELAASLIKVADVCKALGEHDEADHNLRTAHGVCCEVEALQGPGNSLPPHVTRKLQLLMGVLQAQGQHMGLQGQAGSQAAAAAASDS